MSDSAENDGAGVCPTACDEDCEADCHERHQPRWKRTHKPEDCPGACPSCGSVAGYADGPPCLTCHYNIPPDLCPTCRETLPCLTCGAGL